jgi:Tol biopolymer transport system component
MSSVPRVAILGLMLSIGSVAPASSQNTTTRVSVATGGNQGTSPSRNSDISADGRYVAFTSVAGLVVGDTNNFADIFVHDRDTGTTERVSVSSGGAQTIGDNTAPSISANGRFVAFSSRGANLVGNDTNGVADVFVRDRDTSVTTRVSFVLGAGQGSNDSTNPVISADGRYVAYTSHADNLVAGDTNNVSDVFLHDRTALTTVRVSVATGGAQSTDGLGALVSSISADGRIVAFNSTAADLSPGDTNNARDVFVRDVIAGTTTRVGVEGNRSSAEGYLSADGRYVVFRSLGDTTGRSGIYLHDRQSGVTSPLSVAAVGVTASPDFPDISGDGRYICFAVPRPGTDFQDIVVIDRQTLGKTRVSVATNGDVANRTSTGCTLNGDGTVVTYTSAASNLVANDTNGLDDIFVRTFVGTMSLDKTTLAFAAQTSTGAFVSQTAAQAVQLTQSGVGTITWTAGSRTVATGESRLGHGIVDAIDQRCAIGWPPGEWDSDRHDRRLTHRGCRHGAADHREPDAGAEQYLLGSVRDRRHARGQSHRRDRRGALHWLGARRHRSQTRLDLSRVLRIGSRSGRSELRRRRRDLRRLCRVHRWRAARRQGRVSVVSTGVTRGLGLHGADEHAAEPRERNLSVHDARRGS